MLENRFFKKKKNSRSGTTKNMGASLTSRTSKALCLASLLWAAQASAEQSAWFLGADINYGFANKFKVSVLDRTEQAYADSVGFGVVAGYKQMFTNYFGLRYYANIDYFPFFTYSKFRDLGNTEHSLLNAAINIDALVNFYNTQDFNMGAFVGAQLGINGWGGKLFRLEKKLYDGFVDGNTNYEASNGNLTFSANLNLGMRFNFGRHGFEVYGIIPFTDSKLTNLKDIIDADKNIHHTHYNSTMKFPYVTGLRYVYNF